jgi:hypothetical protein
MITKASISKYKRRKGLNIRELGKQFFFIEEASFLGSTLPRF